MIVPITPPPKQVAVTPDVAFKRAIELQQSGDLAGSEKIYRAILKQYPKHFETLANLWISVVVLGAVGGSSPIIAQGAQTETEFGDRS